MTASSPPAGDRVRPLSGRVAIVTGGGSGIGRASAARLAGDGAVVVVSDIDATAAETTTEVIRRTGGVADAVVCDVADEGAVAALVDHVIGTHGSLDVVHNNAALTDPTHQRRDLGPVEIDLAVWERALAVNLTGPMLLCKHAIPHMLATGRGAIVNMSSLAGRLGDVNGVAYATSKAGIEALTRAVATKYGRRGVRCNAIAPGIVMTESVTANLTDEIVDEYHDNVLVPRLGSPDDIAGVVAFLVGDDAAYINGEVIAVDGGLGAHTPTLAGIRRRMAAARGAGSRESGN